jgi:hypothetical protein
MGKEATAIVTIFAFIVFSFSCYSTKAIKVETGHKLEGKKLKIAQLQKKSGEYFEYKKAQTVQVSRNTIVGNLVLKEYVVDRSNIEKTERGKNGKIIRVTTKDGMSLNPISTQELNGKIIVVAYEYTRLPLSDIDILWVKKTNILGTIGLVYLGLAVLGILVWNTGDRSFFNN